MLRCEGLGSKELSKIRSFIFVRLLIVGTKVLYFGGYNRFELSKKMCVLYKEGCFLSLCCTVKNCANIGVLTVMMAVIYFSFEMSIFSIV